jgi:hypothetical protein
MTALRLQRSPATVGLLIVSAVACAIAARTAAAAVLVNEILYDPDGSDSGLEFVELINTGTAAVCLDGYVLMAGDGARQGSWSARWRGAPADTIEAGGLYVVAELDVPEAQAYAQLGLQNGPDGCALVRDEASLDVVGWGPLQYAEYYEGAPAPDVASGASLARVPDGRDTGDNSADFAEARDPTPGRPNAIGKDIGFAESGVEAQPLNPEVGEAVSITARLVSAGQAPGGADVFDFRLDATRLSDGVRFDVLRIGSALSPGDTTVLRGEWIPPTAGLFVLEGTVDLQGDQSEGNNVATLAVRAGPGPLIISEIMYDPLGGGEWIEVFNGGALDVELRGWRLQDRSGGGVEIASATVAPPGGYAVVCQDSAALAGRYAGIESYRVAGSFRGRWAALNNSDGPDGIADVITLYDESGMPSDVAAYSTSLGGGEGVSLERLRPDLSGRRSDNWYSSVAPGGATPGAVNCAGYGVGSAGGLLSVSPAFVYVSGARRAPARISYDLPFRPSKLRVSVYSLDGREVALLADGEGGPPRGSLLWDGRGTSGDPLPAGAYIVLLAGRDPRGKTAGAKAVVVVR